MKKWIFICLGVIVVLFVVAVAVVLSRLGPIVKTAVNTYGPEITDTEMRVDDVGISLFSAEARLKKFFLGNPKGFNSPSAIKVGSILVDVDEDSLARDAIIINKIEVLGPEITYETRGATDNFRSILSNVQKRVAGKESKGKKPADSGPGKQLIIDDFILKNGQVRLAVAVPGGVPADRQISADLPDIHLKGIGKKSNGVSAAEAAREIIAVVYRRITAPEVLETLNDQIKGLKGAGAEAVQKAAEKQLKEAVGAVGGTDQDAEKVTDKLKGLFQKKE